MYTSIRAQVVIDGNLSQPFDLHLGVRQGCPASPLVFSLFMDRLEEWIARGVQDLTAREWDAVRVAGMLIPMLLFADDIVLLGRQPPLVQRLLDILDSFCADSSLNVSLKKTKWLLGGAIHQHHLEAMFTYRG